MKIVDRSNTHGASIYASVHVNADTEASVLTGKDEGDSVIKIGFLNVFIKDEDLEILSAAISKYVRAKKRKKKNTF